MLPSENALSEVTHRPNEAIKRIAAGVKTSFYMIKTSNRSSASLSAAIRLSFSR